MPHHLPTSFAFVDTETTGTNSLTGRIIEIGIIRVENGQVVDTLNTLINPETFISPFITQITGIQSQELETAPTFAEIHRQIRDILKDCCFVAHNVRFDFSFIKNEFKRLGIEFHSPMLCTVKLSRHLFPTHHHHNLDSIIDRFNLDVTARHRAFADAQAIYDYFNLAKAKTSPKLFTKTLGLLLKKPSFPSQLDRETVDNLPESPGVYIFYGENQSPLYIGKSKNIKSRVYSHFQGDLTSHREMKLSQTIRSLKAIPTAGELGALLLESSLIKQVLPLYNRLLRQSKKLYLLRQVDGSHGYRTVKLEQANSLDTSTLNDVVSIFRSKKQALASLDTVAKQHKLCPKILGLENSRSACFSYHLGQCQGACIGKETPTIYNLRFLLAFAKTQFQPWPYDGPILITESNPTTGLTQYHLADQWLYLASFESEYDLVDFPIKSESLGFDYDSYKILRRFLASPPPHCTIKPFKPLRPSATSPY